MKGQVLGFDAARDCWLVSGADGNRYQFAAEDCMTPVSPKPGDEVVFETDGNKANAVFLTINAAQKVIRKEASFSWSRLFFGFNGRINRFTYLVKGVVVIFVASILICAGLLYALQPSGPSDAVLFQRIVMAVLGITMIWPSTAIVVKRLHDLNMSAWWHLWALIAFGVAYSIGLDNQGPVADLLIVITVIYSFVIQMLLIFRPGAKASNSFGEPQS